MAFREMPLESLPSCVEESYRLMWVPTFHPPVVVRIWRSGEKYFMAAKQLDGRGGYEIGKLSVEQTRSLTNDEWMNFVTSLYQAGFWDIPSNINEPVPQDGAAWVMEGIKGKQYHSIKRRNPQGEYADLIKYLIKLSGLKTEHDKYLL